MNRMKYRQATGFVGLAAAVLLVGASSLAQAQYPSQIWNAGTAAWSNTANWTAGNVLDNGWAPGQLGGGSVINNGGTATIGTGENATDTSNNGLVIVGAGGSSFSQSGNGYVAMSGGTLANGASALTEVFGVTSGSGIFTQTGGTNAPFTLDPSGSVGLSAGQYSAVVLGFSNGGYGEYDMSGGSLGANVIEVGANIVCQPLTSGKALMNAGTGVFTQTGGTIGSFGALENKAIGLMIGGDWSNNLSKTATNYSSLGTYTLGATTGTGAPLFVGGVEAIGISGTGSFIQNAGTNAIVGGGLYAARPGGGSTIYNNSIGALLLGWYSGRVAPNSTFSGNGVGSYTLNGGLLTGSYVGINSFSGLEVVGVAGTGIFNQTGGTNQAFGSLNVGGGQTSSNQSIFSMPTEPGYGTYSLSGGLLTTGTGSFENVGFSGTGIFTQTAGTNVTGAIYLAGNAYNVNPSNAHLGENATPGTYNLNGGLLQTGNIYVGGGGVSGYSAGVATFNFTGGTLQAAPAGQIGPA